MLKRTHCDNELTAAMEASQKKHHKKSITKNVKTNSAAPLSIFIEAASHKVCLHPKQVIGIEAQK
jgi:hypothetical protein